MPLVSMRSLLTHAEKNKYAVGYFESWDMHSLLGVMDAAEKMRSPVIVGFNGGFIGSGEREIPENIYHYAGLGLAVCAHASVPAALILNEAESVPLLIKGLKAGFNVIMHDHESCSFEESLAINKYLVRTAHAQDAEVEAEIGQLPAADVSTNTISEGFNTDPEKAVNFIRETDIDALAVAVGNVHMLEGRKKSMLDLNLIEELRKRISIPLVIHGGTGIDENHLKDSISAGISKVNVGTVLRRALIDTLKQYFEEESVDRLDPNEATSKGGNKDMLVRARKNICAEVCRFMNIFGSENKASLR